MRPTLSLLALTMIACGGANTSTTEDDGSASSAGGEAEAPRLVPIRTTTPVPVPQPAVAREDLSEPLQAVWTQIEETVAVRPPEAPEESTVEAVNEWAQGPFSEWLNERRARMQEAIAMSGSVPDDPAHERALAAALLGYALEDFTAGFRGAPVPASIATDQELLDIYAGTLMEQIRPLATEAVLHYAWCQRRLAALGDESPWLEWRAYCVERGQEVIEVYGIAPPPEEGEPQAEPGPTS